MAVKSIRALLSAITIAATAMVTMPATTVPAIAESDGYTVLHNGHSQIRCRGNSRSCLSRQYQPRGWHGRHYKHRHHGHRHYGHRHHKHSRRHYNDGAAAAIIGLGTLAIVGGALANQNRTLPHTADPNYRGHRHAKRPHVYTHAGALEPWSPGWYEWCDNRYRSFNARTGTFRGYDGRDHFCVPR